VSQVNSIKMLYELLFPVTDKMTHKNVLRTLAPSHR